MPEKPLPLRTDWKNPGTNRFAVPALPPDQFLYGRRGPWPQPSPSHPLGQAPEIMNVPATEQMVWNQTIGARYLKTQIGYPPVAANLAAKNLSYTGPDDTTFDAIMCGSSYTRFMRPYTGGLLKKAGLKLPANTKLWVFDFRAMGVVEPIEGTWVSPVRLFVVESAAGGESSRYCAAIEVGVGADAFIVIKARPAWALCKVFVLQAAAYHMLFVVHPAIHFPLDAINAITKTAVPHMHPIFQLLLPHTTYSMMLDHVVLDDDVSVVSNDVQGNWSSPLTGDAPNLKLLFSAGYSGLASFPKSYPRYNYLEPQMGTHSPYLRWLKKYYDGAILPFCTKVADHILNSTGDERKVLVGYTMLWAEYNHLHIYGFPDQDEVMHGDTLARALASFVFLSTVSHGGDHATFGQVSAADKFLRLRIPPPTTAYDNPPMAGKLFTMDDLYRAEMAQQMYFVPHTLAPALSQTGYAFREPALLQAAVAFQVALREVADTGGPSFMPLDGDEIGATIPQSIQY